MSKVEKYDYKELSKAEVVNHQDHIHVNDEDGSALNLEKPEHLNVTDQIKSNDPECKMVVKTEAEFARDLDKVKKESFDEGVSHAKAIYDEQMQMLKVDQDLFDAIKLKLEDLSLNANLEKEVGDLIYDVVKVIAKKIHLILPVDFEQILKSEMISRLSNCYVAGTIKISINPQKRDFCTNLLQSEKLPEEFKSNIEIIEDHDIGINDCKLDWQDTTIKYNHDDLIREVDEIFSQLSLKSDTIQQAN